MQTTSVDTVQETLMLPFGLYFRQVLEQHSTPQGAMAETTSEPEITSDDAINPEKIDSEWIPDEDEDEDDEEE